MTCDVSPVFPKTRYLGSKRRVASTIVHHLASLDYESVLDAFGGTASVSYEFKRAGKKVTYNDVLAFNHQIGIALIENDETTVSAGELSQLGDVRDGVQYRSVIRDSFSGIYFTDEENTWLDTAVANTRLIKNRFQRAMTWYALFQAALAKRPFNLFHRANLNLRLKDVERSFGNKASWDRSFRDHMRRFAREANDSVMRGPHRCKAISHDARDIKSGYDLVYLDPPYIRDVKSPVDYGGYYHFLEGMVTYDTWAARIDWSSRHRRTLIAANDWCKPQAVHRLFQEFFACHRLSQIAVSYRDDGIPTIDELSGMLKRLGFRVQIQVFDKRAYALSNRKSTREILIIATRPAVRMTSARSVREQVE